MDYVFFIYKVLNLRSIKGVKPLEQTVLEIRYRLIDQIFRSVNFHETIFHSRWTVFNLGSVLFVGKLDWVKG